MEIKEVPDNMVLLQRTNRKASHAACVDGSAWHGFLFQKINGKWVSIKKLSDWEIQQAKDHASKGVVYEHCTIRA